MSKQDPFDSSEFIRVTAVAEAGPDLNLVTFPGGFRCYSHTSIEETELMYNEIFRQKEYLAYAPPLEQMNTMVDAGANIGLFTLFAKKGNPNLAVYAFEPIRETYAVLLRNIELHHLEGVKPFNFALGSEDQMERIFTYYLHMAENSTANPGFKKDMIKLGEEKFEKEWMERDLVSETRVTRVRTLSSIIRELDIPSIDFLIIDTEGDEDAVLDGIQEEQFGIIRHIAMKIHTEKLYRDIQKSCRNPVVCFTRMPALPNLPELPICARPNRKRTGSYPLVGSNPADPRNIPSWSGRPIFPGNEEKGWRALSNHRPQSLPFRDVTIKSIDGWSHPAG